MASSVARLSSAADDWGDRGHLAVSVLGASHGRPSYAPAGIMKVHIHQQKKRVGGDAPSSASPAADLDPIGKEERGESRSSARRRESQILNKWAARQAREMVTTIEREAQQAEISTITTTGRPVSARAGSLRRESSLSGFLESSSTASAGCSGDLRANVRASSLIQMWRELEAEAGATTKHQEAFGGVGSNAEDACGGDNNSDVSDALDTFGDWSSDMMSMASTGPANSASASPMHESEMSRVGSIVRMLTSSYGAGGRFVAPLNNDNNGSGRESPAADKAERPRGKVSGPLGMMNSRPLRGRGEMESFVARMEQERRRELVALADHHHVSRFAYCGRLQSMLKLRSFERRVAIQDQMRAPSRRFQLDQMQNGSTISVIRERFNHRRQCSGSKRSFVESSSSVHIQFPAMIESTEFPISVDVQFPVNAESSDTSIHVQFPMDAEGSVHASPTDQFPCDKHQLQEIDSPRDSTSIPMEACSPMPKHNEPQDENHKIDGSWDDRNLWVDNLDWQRPLESLPSNGWESEVAVEDMETSPRQGLGPLGGWIGDQHSESWRWSIRRKPQCYDWFEHFSDNVEIRDLLERKRVSTSLASDFCNKMNQLVLSFIQRRDQYCSDENFAENSMDYPFWQQSLVYQNAEPIESDSSSMVPLHYYNLQAPEKWQNASFTGQSSQNVDREALNDLRSEMTQIHEEIGELRLMVQNCMEWQDKLRQSIKQDILDAINQSSANSSLNFKAKSGRRDTCRICCQMQVDCLLYRCGHMCTCFNCAHQLQWSSAKCPICQAPIIDIVQTIPNS
ncbi:uncharacterized protein LOC122042597 isoform X1 [Zingiber officinale]|uniref:RING-type domain-containing protein n=1 Tax=Zingiber officinale TaxID=94328 RepID=A0A8J5I6J5_ZINOF|nr:uncharacterized protein LOC122042597 isoform X1 [Zingiber officinale]KAG6529656.1 hypothetical protein ZIOFF_011869 [Zingiber officinale]